MSRFIVTSRAQRRQLKADNARYPADTLIDIPRDAWPVGLSSDAKRTRVLRGRDFMVQEFAEAGGVVRLSIMRTAVDPANGRWRDGISWDELQRLKAMAGHADACAVEIYPPEAELVDVANMRHLWILPVPPSFMWQRKGGAA